MQVKNLLSAEDAKILRNAIHSELYASNLYKHLANQMQRLGFFGAQKFFASESATELEHYQKHVEFLNDMGAVASVPAIEAMTATIQGLPDAIKVAYDTEVQLGQDYARWHGEAKPMTAQHLLQFIEIQRESIGEYADIISRINIAGNDGCALLIIDKELGE